MTDDDRVYGEWLNLLGSGLLDDSVLHTLHDRAEASHQPPPTQADADDYAAAQADALRLGTEA
jgi:hypothetical protein